MLDLGQYCLIATGCGHDGRVAQLRDYNKLVLLTAGSTYIGDYFSVPFHIKVKPISAKHAHSLIKKSNK